MLPEQIERALVRREPLDVPVAVVVAHSDDETIGAGPLLHLFRRLTLVHVTDGAPRDRRDAEAAGFASCEAYAAARAAELREALRIGGVAAELVSLGVPDQQAAHRLSWLVGEVRRLLGGARAVFTHAYEGGHPDHDAVAFAVQAAGVPRIEMTGYHAASGGGIEIGRFLPGDCSVGASDGLSGGAPKGPPGGLSSGASDGAWGDPSAGAETVLALTPAECLVREAMLDAFRTQRATLQAFRGAGAVRLRMAPRYHFSRPPAGRVYYDGFPWGMTSERWCALAVDALR